MLEALMRRKAIGDETSPYRFWRIRVDAQNTSVAVILAEVALRDAAGDVITAGYDANATASGYYSSDYYPRFAFDGIIPTAYGPGKNWQVNHAPPNWIQIEIPVARAVTSYSIYTPNDQVFRDYSFNSWTLLGSNDGVNWITVDAQTGYTVAKWATATEHVFTITKK